MSAVTRATLIERRRVLRAEIEQIFIDAAYWNSLHPDQTPIDPDLDGQLRRIAKAIDAAVSADREGDAPSIKEQMGKV